MADTGWENVMKKLKELKRSSHEDVDKILAEQREFVKEPFKIHFAALKGKDIPENIFAEWFARGYARTEIKHAINARHQAHRNIVKALKFMKQIKFSDFADLQWSILFNIRDSIQKSYEGDFMSYVLRQRALNKLKDFFKKHPLTDKEVRGFQEFKKDFRKALAIEMHAAHGLEKVTQSPTREQARTAALGIKWRSLFFFDVRFWRNLVDMRLVSREFKIESIIEKIENKSELTEKDYRELVHNLIDFTKVSAKLSQDLSILNLRLIQEVMDYEEKVEKAVAEIKLPKIEANRIKRFVELRAKAYEIFHNKTIMINNLASKLNEAENAIKILDKVAA